MFIILIQDCDYSYVYNYKVLFIKKRDGIIYGVAWEGSRNLNNL